MMKKKILLVIPSNNGRIAGCFYNLYIALSAQKDVTVYTANMSHISNGSFHFETVLSIEEKKCNYFTKIRKLKEIKKKYKIDISVSALVSCNLLNIFSKCSEKTIGIFHAPLNQNKILGNITYMLSYVSYKFLFPKLDKVFCVSESVKSDVLSNMWIDKSKVDVVYNIHDVTCIREKADEAIDPQYEYIFRKNILLYVGKLYNIKSPDRLLRAYAEIKNRDVQLASTVNVVFIGKDVRDTQKKLDVIIETYGIQDNIFFIGVQSNPYKYMKRATALISPSKSEGLPGVLIESLLLNTPVIASNSSLGVWEILGLKYSKKKCNHYALKGIITSNENVLDSLDDISISYDDKKMADAIISLLHDKELYNRMKKAPFLFESQITPDIARKYII